MTAVAGSTIDDIAMTTLDASSLSNPFAVRLTAAAVTTGFSATSSYTWQIAGFGGAVTGLSNGTLATANGSGANIATFGELFTLDTSSFATANGLTSSSGSFALELLGSSGSQTLDVAYTAAPEPGTAMLVLAGVVPMLLMGRRRRSESAETFRSR